MNVSQYVDSIQQFDRYPSSLKPGVYFLGLVGEISELNEKVYWEELALKNIPTNQDFIYEVGDVLWYWVSLCRELDIDYNNMFRCLPVKAMILGDQITAMKKIMPFIVRDAGKVLGYHSKSIRDDGAIITPSRKESISEKMYYILCNIYKILVALNTTIESTMDKNIDKLTSRKTRDKISGEGDLR